MLEICRFWHDADIMRIRAGSHSNRMITKGDPDALRSRQSYKRKSTGTILALKLLESLKPDQFGEEFWTRMVQVFFHL